MARVFLVGATGYIGSAVLDLITSMPVEKAHRLTDKLVFDASPLVNVAIIAPVGVQGLSPSPAHPYPLIIPGILTAIQALGQSFTISAGQNIVSYVHVLDCAPLYLILLSHALKPSIPGIFRPKAYYFATAEEVSFADFLEKLVMVAKRLGIVEKEEVLRIDVQTGVGASGANESHGEWEMTMEISFGTDMRCRAERAKASGLVPREKGVLETVDDVVTEFWMASGALGAMRK